MTTPECQEPAPDPVRGLVGFTAVLRHAGLPVTTERVTAFLTAVDALGTGREQVYRAGLLTLCGELAIAGRNGQFEIAPVFDVDVIDAGLDRRFRIGIRRAAIREDDRFRRRRAKRMKIDRSEPLRAQLDRVVVHVE